jgi:probable F420-dependent oxidoreductase
MRPYASGTLVLIVLLSVFAKGHVMKLGYFDFNPDYSIRPDDLARACEARGYHSLWLGEHINIPVSRRTPYPLGGELPKYYSHMRDPFISLMAAGAVTKNLKLATGICLMTSGTRSPRRKKWPPSTLSNGRVIFGIGGGWNVEEMENHGMPFSRRWKVLRERVLAMKAIWSQDEPSFHGEFVNFDTLWSYPKPVQKPHPPIIMGSIKPQGLQRIVDYCDGWCPADMAIEDFRRVMAELRERSERAGRDPRSLSISIFAAGDPEESKLYRYRELGIDRVVLGVEREDVDVKEKVLPFLDRYAKLILKLA